MSKDWTPTDLAAANNAMVKAGFMSFPELIAKTEPDLKCFYYTFGSDEKFPHRNGWVIVAAHDWDEADAKFRARFPDRPGHEGLLNCAFTYSADRGKEIDPEHTWTGYQCYEILA